MALELVLSATPDGANAVKLAAVATGGVGPYEYEYHVSTTAGFTPGPGNKIAGIDDGDASPTVTGLIPNTQYYFKAVVTDTGNSNDTASSNQSIAVTQTGNQNPNQFSQESVAGKVDQLYPPNTLNVEVSQLEAGVIRSGYPVKITSQAGGIPKVVRATADTDKILGYVNYNFKQSEYVAGDRMQISSTLNVIELPAGAAITRGTDVVLDADPACVLPSTGSTGKRIVGWAFDGAQAPGQLLRVQLYGPLGGLDS